MHRIQGYSYFCKNADRILELRMVAQWRDLSLMCYREDENGGIYCRNIYSKVYGGYVVEFPGEPDYFAHDQRATLQEWEETQRLPIVRGYMTDEDFEFLCEETGGFKYTLKKWRERNGGRLWNDLVMEAYLIWKKHPEIEFLLAGGFTKLAFTPALYTRSENQRKNIMRILKDENRNITLKEAETRIKYGISAEQYEEYKSLKDKVYKDFGFTWPEYCYIKKNIDFETTGSTGIRDFCEHYKDLKRMLKELGKSKDDYWHFPKDIKKIHDKAVREVTALREFKEAERIAGLQKDYLKRVFDFLPLARKIGKFDIYIPEYIADWTLQADTLHQCIITGSYDKKVIDGKCLIVFIRENGIPKATVEIFKSGKIGQFYADEHAKNIYPTKDIKEAFGKWHESFMNRIKELKEHEKECA